MSNVAHKPLHRWALTGLAAASLLASAGCAANPPAPAGGAETPAESSEAAAPETNTESSPAAESPDATESDAPAESAGSYADGTYTATGSYQTPGGEEEIGVTITLDGDTVADVQTEPMPSNPTTELYQGKFSSGIKDEIVGKPLDELTVSKVAGSSLTSGGFAAAVDQIKGDAAQ